MLEIDKNSGTSGRMNFLLPEGAEIIGILKAVTSNAFTLQCSKHNITVAITSDISEILEKATQFVGRKVAILHFNHRFYIREIRDRISVFETPIDKNKKAKKMQHNLMGKCCKIRRCLAEGHVFQTSDIS
ncbi:MAG: hypothetical protein QXY59_01500 [Candidatus Korarchaeota archaeon]